MTAVFLNSANLWIEFIYYNFIFVTKIYVAFLLAVWYDFPIGHLVFLKVHKRTIHKLSDSESMKNLLCACVMW